MGQNNSEICQNRSIFPQNWHPLPQQSDVLINRLTHQQVQTHRLLIPIKDLPRQTTLLSARTKLHHPYVCRLLYFHVLAAENKQDRQTERQPTEIRAYTDRMLKLKTRDWTKQKIMHILQGLKRLVMIYGPFRISDGMICQNQLAEIKVWISHNPTQNHPDCVCQSEEQTTASLACLITGKSQELTSLLLGCRTLREITDKLMKVGGESNSPFHSYSHRASDSGDLHTKKHEGEKFILNNYRNVFGEVDQRSKIRGETQQGCKTPKAVNKTCQNYPHSSVGMMNHPAESKPQSNASNFNKYRDFFQPVNKIGATLDERLIHKSNPKTKFLHDGSIDYTDSMGEKKKTAVFGNLSANYQEVKHNFLERSNQNLGHPSKGPNKVGTHNQSFKQFAMPHRFQTMNNFSSPNFLTPKASRPPYTKPVHEPSSFPNQNHSNNTTSNEQPKTPNSHGPKTEAKRGFDVTIINNNVNNYINHITHNHLLHPNIPKNDHIHFRPPKTPEFAQFSSTPNNRSGQVSQLGRNVLPQNKVQNNIPIFIQQKKKQVSSHSNEQLMAFTNKNKSLNTILRKDTVSSNPNQRLQEGQPNYHSQFSKTQESFIPKIDSGPQLERRNQKLFTFCRPNKGNHINDVHQKKSNEAAPLSPYKVHSMHSNKVPFYNSSFKPSINTNMGYLNAPNFSPNTSSPPGFFQRNSRTGFSDFVLPSRTKTTDFNNLNKSREMAKQYDQQNKSFNLSSDFIKRKDERPDFKQSKYIEKSPIIQENIELLPTTKSIALPIAKSNIVEAKEAQTQNGQKVDLKKQLRLQFGSLLGGQNRQKQPAQQRKQPQNKQLFQNTAQQMRMGGEGLKDKIKMKQMAFAELKKEALMVLTDD